MQERMNVTIWGETFEIQCNRYHNVGDYKIEYDIFDTKSDLIRRIEHTHTHKVPDIEQFKLFSVTLLVHHLDGRVADTICQTIRAINKPIIPIHDAFIVHPNQAQLVRTTYTDTLMAMHTDRKSILSTYFKSIGIGAEAQEEWEQVKSLVTPLPENFTCSIWALK